KEAMMLKTVVLAVGLIAIISIAQAQQQQCQLECTWVNEKSEKNKIKRSCQALNASDCANLGGGESGGKKTGRGCITSKFVQDRGDITRRKDRQDCAQSRHKSPAQ